MNLKEYQNKAVDDLCIKAKKLLRMDGTKRLVFKSPTGSGKTVMAAEFLKQMAEDGQVHPFACVWAAPRKLHTQSREKLHRYYANTRTLNCAEFSDLTDRQIAERQILFLNWESIHQKNNIIIRENEQDQYLDKVLENTRDAQRNIILLIDESHHHISEITDELISAMAPKLIIEISATPILKNPDEMVAVHLQEVKAEGMIKKSVIINEGANKIFGKNSSGEFSDSPDESVLQHALKKRQQLADAFRIAGAEVNPLVCVQIPDRRLEQDDNIRTAVEQNLRKSNITVENGKFAVYLSDNKENLEGISDNNNEVEVLLFKQAIALGWDCPRAHILVLFRNWHSVIFSVQTLGRIMRMPEPDIGHYADGILNSSYVYTNLPAMSIHEDMVSSYVHVYTSWRKGDYSPLQLPSVHRLRQREKTRISPQFSALFLQAAQEYNLHGKLNFSASKVSDTYINEYSAEGVDAITGQTVRGNKHFDVTNEEHLQRLFDYFVRDNLAPYYPEDRSIGNVKKAIYDFFKAPLLTTPMDFSEDFEKVIKIILSDENRDHFVKVLAKAKEKYQEKTAGRKEPLQETKDWEVPESITYGENYRHAQGMKSIMQPFYVQEGQSGPEKAFIEFLEQHENVCWWYKNGESESMYFAVPYTENGEQHPFYVDFIVRLKDGRIGLFDTKGEITIQVAKEKSDGLLAYIKDINRNRPAAEKLIGGIVTPDPNNPTLWRIYEGKGADLTSKNIAQWGWLDLG